MYGKYKPSLEGKLEISREEAYTLTTEILIKAKAFEEASIDIAPIKSYEYKTSSKVLRFAISGLTRRLVNVFMAKRFGLTPQAFLVENTDTSEAMYGSVISFIYKGCQVDLELVPFAEIIFALFLRSGEGMGYILQKLYSKLGLDLSEKGLYVNIPKEISGLEGDTDLMLSLDRGSILGSVEVGQGLLTGGTDLLSIAHDLNLSPHLTEDVLDSFTEAELSDYSELELFENNMSLLRSLVAASNTKMSGQIPEHIIKRNAIRLFGCEDRYRQRIIQVKLQRNKENLVNNKKFFGIVGYKLSKTQKEDFLGYYRVVRPRYDQWMSSVPETAVIEDIRKHFNEWKQAMDSIYPANSFEIFGKTSTSSTNVDETSEITPVSPPPLNVSAEPVSEIQTVPI